MEYSSEINKEEYDEMLEMLRKSSDERNMIYEERKYPSAWDFGRGDGNYIYTTTTIALE